MPQGSFTAQIVSNVAAIKANREAIYKESAQRTVAVMQTTRSEGGNMRVDTGFLRASLMATTASSLPAMRANPGSGRFSYDSGQISLVILGADLKETITVAYTANYARPREYGSRGQPGDRFVGLAAQQWRRIVDEVCAEVRAKTGQ